MNYADADKIVAATLTAALVRTLNEQQEDIALAMYRRILDKITPAPQSKDEPFRPEKLAYDNRGIV